MESTLKTKNTLLKTAKIFEDFGETAKAAHYYAQAGQYQKSARLYEKVEDYEKSGNSYFQEGNLRMALKMYNKAGRRDKRVALIYETLGEFKFAADIWKSLGNMRRWKKCQTKFREPTIFDMNNKHSG